jgi:hypothetical protein
MVFLDQQHQVMELVDQYQQQDIFQVVQEDTEIQAEVQHLMEVVVVKVM